MKEWEELDMHLGIAELLYTANPPSGKSIAELVRAIKILASSSKLADVSWDLLSKVWLVRML